MLACFAAHGLFVDDWESKRAVRLCLIYPSPPTTCNDIYKPTHNLKSCTQHNLGNVGRSVVSAATDQFSGFWWCGFPIGKSFKIGVYAKPKKTGAVCTTTFSHKMFLASTSINISQLILDYLKTEVVPGG